MASSDEASSDDNQTFRSIVQVAKESPRSMDKRSRRRQKSRSRSPLYGEDAGFDRRQKGKGNNQDSDEGYYERKRKVQSFIVDKENYEKSQDSERDEGEISSEDEQKRHRDYGGDDYYERRQKVQSFIQEKEQQRSGEDSDEDVEGERSMGRYRDRYGDRVRDNKDRNRMRYRGMDLEREIDNDRYSDRDRHRERRERDERRDRDEMRDRDERRQRDKRRPRDDESYREQRESRRERAGKEAKEIPEKEREEGKEEAGKKEEVVAEKKKDPMDILTRTGGAYIPPARLRLMQEGITDKTSVAYQRMAWEALKKSINGIVNKINVANIANIVQELFEENIVRGRGLFCQSVMRAQVASPVFTNVYAALIAIVNTKFPKIGELMLRRLILQFRRAFRRNDKTVCMNSARFIAHLVNQQVAHELLSLEVLTLLLQNPTDDSVEVAVGFLKEVGQKLSEVSPRGLNAVFERLRNILNEGAIDKRVQYMLEVMFAIRKDQFKDHQAVLSELDLVEEDDQITHLLRLEENGATEDILNVFKHDPGYEENEEKYKQIKKEILGDGSEDDSSGEEGDSDDDDEDDDENEEDGAEGDGGEKMTIIDQTETNLVALRRTIYLTIQSSLDYEECAHKMMKMQLKPGQEHEFCLMIIDCCSQQRTYEKFFGLLAQAR